ncbi:MAG: glycosyltransferase family 4 protein [Bacteroidales bacterium]|jgi:glycosyltransferase involved in cell wall biosynthesis|nr:glycosyltransferase family 4 protein [Bacteroidales bacterium]
MKVLFLSAWYPHRFDAMAGLFVRKHAQALARYADVCVLYVHDDETIRRFEIIEQQCENVRETYVYFPFSKNRFLQKISKSINYARAYIKGYTTVKQSFGKPDITQVNILTRTAILAYLLKISQKIPYTIIEHWSRYMPQNNSYEGWVRKRITEFVVKRAAALMLVSNYLRIAMLNCNIHHKNTIIVNNVVDDFFFMHEKKEGGAKKIMLHISCFDEKVKNVCGIVRAAKLLSENRSDFELIIVGYGRDFTLCYDEYTRLHFPENMVKFVGELAPPKVEEYLKRADFVVMFSNYDNAPVVISESLAAGKPVVATRVAGIPEMIHETNGILVEVGNERELAEKMEYMLDNAEKYDAETISKEAQKYSYETVGKELVRIYKSVM